MRSENATVGPTIRASNSADRLRSAARLSLAVLLATTALGVVSARAVDGTWTGASSNDWVDGTNWTSTPTAPTGTATFAVSGVTGVISSGFVQIGAVVFTNTSSTYTIGANDFFLVQGAG